MKGVRLSLCLVSLILSLQTYIMSIGGYGHDTGPQDTRKLRVTLTTTTLNHNIGVSGFRRSSTSTEVGVFY